MSVKKVLSLKEHQTICEWKNQVESLQMMNKQLNKSMIMINKAT